MVKLSEIIELIQSKSDDQLSPIPVDLGSIEIKKPSDLIPGDPNGITFCLEKHANKLNKTNCRVIMIPISLNTGAYENRVYLRVKDPKSLFIDVCETFFPSRILPSERIHSTAIIDNDSSISESAKIGAYSIIYKSKVGADCLIYPGVVIYNTEIGNNVVIKPGTVVGYDGFGYYSTGEENQIKKFPHYGKVIIEDGVTIGANVTIDRGALSNTIIRKNVKIDNLVHVAHGDDIGEQVIITAGVSLGGSAKVGKGTWLGIGAIIKNGVKIGKKAFVAMGAVVNQDIQDEKKVIGNLAIDRDLFIRNLKKSLKTDEIATKQTKK